MSILSGDYTLTDIPYVNKVIKEGSTNDYPLVVFIIFIMLAISIVALIGIYSYCRFGKKVGICQECW